MSAPRDYMASAREVVDWTTIISGECVAAPGCAVVKEAAAGSAARAIARPMGCLTSPGAQWQGGQVTWRPPDHTHMYR